MSQAIKGKSVASLFHTDRKVWDVKIVKDIFNEQDQVRILNTPLHVSDDVDVLYWRLENTGLHSVKSAYKLLQLQRGNWPPQEKHSNVWKSLWNIKAPPKAVNVVWRALA